MDEWRDLRGTLHKTVDAQFGKLLSGLNNLLQDEKVDSNGSIPST